MLATHLDGALPPGNPCASEGAERSALSAVPCLFLTTTSKDILCTIVPEQAPRTTLSSGAAIERPPHFSRIFAVKLPLQFLSV